VKPIPCETGESTPHEGRRSQEGNGRIVAERGTWQGAVDALKRLQAEAAAEFDPLLPAILDRAFKGEL
jgi:hypothetical protein